VGGFDVTIHLPDRAAPLQGPVRGGRLGERMQFEGA
jgi:hypothetical protein